MKYDFYDYALSLNPSVLSLPIMGHAETLDGYGRSVTYEGDGYYTKPTRRGFGYYPNSNGRVRISHGAEQVALSQTIMVFSDGFTRPSGTVIGQYLVSKYDAIGLSWVFQLYVDGSSNPYIYQYANGFAFKRVLYDYNNKRSLAVSFVDDTSIKFYGEGTLISEEAGVDYSTQPGADIYLGASRTGGFPPIRSTMMGLLICPSELNRDQIYNLHEAFQSVLVDQDPKKTFCLPTKDYNGAVLHLETEPNGDRIVPDLSGAGNHCAVAGRVTFHKESRVVYDFGGDTLGALEIAASASIGDLVQRTIQFSLRNIRDTDGYIMRKTRYYVHMTGATRIYFTQTFTVGTGIWYCDYDGADAFVQITYDGSDRLNIPKMYINGSEVSVSTLSSPGSDTIISDLANPLAIGNRAASLSDSLYGSMDIFKLFPSVLSDDDLKIEYLDYALKNIVRLSPRGEHPVTTGAVSAPGHAGPWTIHAGSAEWLDDGNRRYLKETNISSYASLPSSQASGAWYFTVNRISSSPVVLIHPISLINNGSLASSSSIGYAIALNGDGRLILYRCAGGTFPTVGTTAVGWLPNTGEIELFMTRSITGVFTLYSREANHSVWTQAFQATDATYFTSNYVQTYSLSSAGEYQIYSDLYLWPDGDTLSPNDIPELKD